MDKLVIGFDGRGYDYVGNGHEELHTTVYFLRFYYIYVDTSTNDQLVIEVELDENSRNIMLYVSIVLIVIAGLIFIYLTIVLIRYCLRRRRAQVADPFRSNAWQSQSNARFNRIMNVCSVTSYSQKDTRYGETSCAVCLTPLQEGQPVRILACRHLYHKGCIAVSYTHLTLPTNREV
eukprot:TRINITY_DN962_c0_g1_i3.p3 TRINITY_DN962_c0_g1~~TRINITY_DN962_c0_g1_i3.p3  ORF type:complete len:177 (+),score=26.47 TRINITY_DN962_c0_g1_i3:684-1214(+)